MKQKHEKKTKKKYLERCQKVMTKSHCNINTVDQTFGRALKGLEMVVVGAGL